MAKPEFVKAGTSPAPSFELKEFTDFLKGKGSKLVHYRCLPCPVGRIDPNDTMRRPHQDNCGCRNGFLYRKVGIVKGIIHSGNKNIQFVDQGLMDASPLSATLNLEYEDVPGSVLVAPFDRFYLAEESIVVVHWQELQYSGNTIDFLRFPADSVEELIDASGYTYILSQDYVLMDGAIKWIDKNPGMQISGKGVVYSIRYRYRPWYVAISLGHEIRVTTVKNPVTGVETVKQVYQEIQLRRENVHRGADNDIESKSPKSQQELSPSQVDFGSR